MGVILIDGTQPLEPLEDIRNFISNNYLRIKSWNHKFDQTLNSNDNSLANEFPEESRKEEIIKKLKELIQILKEKEKISNILERS